MAVFDSTERALGRTVLGHFGNQIANLIERETRYAAKHRKRDVRGDFRIPLA